ncbi:MAG: glycosyltransferase [Deltaproteobacteria bacterium]|nr:glycosyltransferase [Deltaproteobacteria bacterium]
MPHPIASIVVTAFDRIDSLSELLEALNHQTLSPDAFEVIIADDSGDWNTGEKALKAIHPQYETTLVRTGLPREVNGVSVARNLGIRKARAPIVISMDDDCLPNRFFVESHVRHHEKGYPHIVLGHRSEVKEKLEEEKPVSVTEEKAVAELILSASDLLNFSHFVTGNLSFPKKVVMEAGLFDESFAQPGEHGWEDIELGYRVWRRGYPTLFERNALVYRPGTEKEKEKKREVTGAIRKAQQRFFSIHPMIPWVQRLMESYRRKKYKTAEETARTILGQDPRNAGVLAMLGYIHIQQEDFSKALECFGATLALNPLNPFFLEQIGEVLYHQDEKREALQFFARALTLEPNRTRSLYFLAHLKELCREQGLGELGGRKIHAELGGGIIPSKLRGEGQDDFISIDVMPWETADVVHDLADSIPFPEGSVYRLFSREMIEHLPYRTLPGFLRECFRVLEPGGTLYLCCPDFERLIAFYSRKCDCVSAGYAKPDCPRCHGEAVVSDDYWRENLCGRQEDYGDGGINGTHKNQITFHYLKALLEKTGFVNIQRDPSNRFYDEHERPLKLSLECKKPGGPAHG